MRQIRLGLIIAAILLSPQTASAQTPVPRGPTATADIRTASSEPIATASLSQAPDEVLISIAFKNRTALVGTHAIHIHGVGQCTAPGFESAGSIFNPTQAQHGLLNAQGPMAGDLPNLVIGTAGVGVYNLSAPLVTLQSGPNSLLGGRGTSLVIFDQADDGKSQPEGNAGLRIACGVIAAGTAGSTPSNDVDLLSAILIALIGGLLIAGGVLLRRAA